MGPFQIIFACIKLKNGQNFANFAPKKKTGERRGFSGAREKYKLFCSTLVLRLNKLISRV